MSLLEPGTCVLFIGDSITDAGRDRSSALDLGHGYTALIAATCADGVSPASDGNLRFINRGISGNRVRDLRERWPADCLVLTPDVVSIMIGVNDTWRRYDNNDPTSAEDFERDYRAILQATVDSLAARLVLVEPFVLPVRKGQAAWREDLDPKIAVVRRLARDYSATLVPLDTVMTRAAATQGAANPAADGAHPTAVGHSLIADTWLTTVRNAG